MMELATMYEVDLSLFGGDLLVDPPLAESELYGVSGLVGLSAKSFKWSDVDHGIGQDVNLATGQADQCGLLDPFGDNWLDRKMDLLELMCMPVTEDDLSSDNPITGNISPLEEKPDTSSLFESSAHAVKLLTEAAQQAVDFPTIKPEPTNVSASTISDGMDLLDMLYDGMSDPTLDIMGSDNVLSPMSPEDIESLLSSAPTSPAAEDSLHSSMTASDFSASDLSISGDNSLLSISVPSDVPMDSDLARLLLAVEENKGQEQVELEAAICPQATSSRAKPYDRKQARNGKAKETPLSKEQKILDRKLRKKQQNKDAATRYRQKKRAENEAVTSELDQLENRNTELKNTVEQMTGEIQYLKNLLAEVYQARGHKFKSNK